MSSSRGFFQPRDWTGVSCIAGGFFTTEPSGKPNCKYYCHLFPCKHKTSKTSDPSDLNPVMSTERRGAEKPVLGRRSGFWTCSSGPPVLAWMPNYSQALNLWSPAGLSEVEQKLGPGCVEMEVPPWGADQLSNPFFFKILLKYGWLIMCVNFCCTAKWVIYIYIYLLIFSLRLIQWKWQIDSRD